MPSKNALTVNAYFKVSIDAWRRAGLLLRQQACARCSPASHAWLTSAAVLQGGSEEIQGTPEESDPGTEGPRDGAGQAVRGAEAPH